MTDTNIKSIRVPLPPLDIQKKIADECMKVDEESIYAENMYQNLNAELYSLYNSLNAEPVKLNTIATVKGGDSFPKGYQGVSDSSLVPFYKVGDMNLPGNEYYMSASNNYVSNEVISKIRSKKHPAGSIIFPKVGMAIHTNKKRMLSIPACVDNNTMVVSVLNENLVLSKFLFYYFVVMVKLSDYASKANPPSMNAATLNQMEIILPSLDKQKEIVGRIETLENDIKDSLSKIMSSSIKKQSIFDKYLK